jgi:hypothetical protein
MERSGQVVVIKPTEFPAALAGALENARLRPRKAGAAVARAGAPARRA